MFYNNNYEILVGDSLEKLKELDDCSVQTCITSPPYFGLRDYGTGKWVGGNPDCHHKGSTVCQLCGAVREDKQIGLEETPEEYIKKLVDVFHEVKRVLKDDGTLWLNIGDSYAGGQGRWGGEDDMSDKQTSNEGSLGQIGKSSKWRHEVIKQKDLIGIPWMLAFALRADGWYLRQDIIWHKPNPMPESVKDRCTKSHEYIFLLSKSPTYYFDYESIQEEATGYDGRKDTLLKGSRKYSEDSYMPNQLSHTMASSGHERWKFKNLQYKGQQTHSMHERRAEGNSDDIYPVRNKRDVWTVPTRPYKGAHFATFPENLIEPCILAGSSDGDTVLDPFNGSGTTGVVAMKHNRKYIGIELNEEYVRISEKRFESMEGIQEIDSGDEEEIKKVKKVSLF